MINIQLSTSNKKSLALHISNASTLTTKTMLDSSITKLLDILKGNKDIYKALNSGLVSTTYKARISIEGYGEKPVAATVQLPNSGRLPIPATPLSINITEDTSATLRQAPIYSIISIAMVCTSKTKDMKDNIVERLYKIFLQDKFLKNAYITIYDELERFNSSAALLRVYPGLEDTLLKLFSEKVRTAEDAKIRRMRKNKQTVGLQSIKVATKPANRIVELNNEKLKELNSNILKAALFSSTKKR